MMNKNTKVVILCGGQGSRIKNIDNVVPKPMLSIGEKPILWHIMKMYAQYGLNDFILCLGYKGWVIKEFFLNYYAKISDITIELGKDNIVDYHSINSENNWKITLAETGETHQTGARVHAIRKYLEDSDQFCLAYGDGVADINIDELIAKHKKSGLLATITGVHPSGRFGEIEYDHDRIVEFNEKPNVGTGLINGGFMVFQTAVLDKYFKSDENQILESDILPLMVKDKNVGIYVHKGFWQCMDTPREYTLLNDLWAHNNAPWKTWA